MKYRYLSRVLGLILILGIFSLRGFSCADDRMRGPATPVENSIPHRRIHPNDSHVKVNVSSRIFEWDLEISGRYAMVSVNSGAMILSGTQLKKCKLGYRRETGPDSRAGRCQASGRIALIQPVEGAFVRLERTVTAGNCTSPRMRIHVP